MMRTCSALFIQEIMKMEKTNKKRICDRISCFIKGEVVLIVSFVLALISCFFVKPSAEYAKYIDFRVLAILIMLMAVVAGMRSIGVFEKLARALINKVKNVRQLVLMLVLMCFFSSMFITNDVALITFVPFSIMALSMANRRDKLISLVVLETVAANLGSMLTPIGNPQNLFIYTCYEMSLVEFIKIILPYCISSLILIVVVILFDKNGKDAIEKISFQENKENDKCFSLKLAYYIALFIVCIGVVVFKWDYIICFIAVLVFVAIMNYKLLVKVDYSLIFTFVFFFVFIGNLGNIEIIRTSLQNTIAGNEMGISILLSQVFSNVPTAMLVSGFTQNYAGLLVGVSIGGLGTLIASMASLISYKIYAKEKDANGFKYLKEFTAVNILFMFILVVISCIF